MEIQHRVEKLGRKNHWLKRGLVATASAVGIVLAMTVTARLVGPVNAQEADHTVHEKMFLSIGGIEQWITIKSEDSASPVILFLHGGPGNTLSPHSDAIYGAWEKDFILVQWDQRAAGKTYGRNEPLSELTLERMAKDGIEVSEYLIRHLGKKKIILLGGSWGSILGVHMAKARPDLFYAYVGTSQIVSAKQNQYASYTQVRKLALAAEDQSALSVIESIGPPPWENPRHFGKLRRIIRKYEAKTTAPAPSSWWVKAAEYDSSEDRANYLAGEEFSYIQFVGLKGDGLFSKVDLPKLGMVFEIPMFIIQGSEDLLTTPEITKRYVDGITAPDKEYVLVPNAGHGPNLAIIEAEYLIMNERVRPLTNDSSN